MKKIYYVIAYDIADDRRRVKVAKILEIYGARINFSVFECLISRTQLRMIKKAIKKIIVHSEDCILYYYLCALCVPKRESVGRVHNILPEVIMV